MAPPFLKVSNRGTQYVDYSKERRNQMRNRVRFSKWKTASGQVKQENQEYFKCIYTQFCER